MFQIVKGTYSNNARQAFSEKQKNDPLTHHLNNFTCFRLLNMLLCRRCDITWFFVFFAEKYSYSNIKFCKNLNKT